MRNVVDGLIAAVYKQCLDNRDGTLADYIPELTTVLPDSFGICIATSDGYVYEVGATDVEFTIQSISKPFTYGMALADRGLAAVAEKIDVEPSGEPFNEISLDPITERPRNPMINAGAITSASLIAGSDVAERFERIRKAYSRYAGRELTLNESVYASEARTGHRNRAIGHMLRSFDIITDNPDDAVDLYFRQCSIDVTCRDLSLMAATMANNGTNPITREQALAPEFVERVLSVIWMRKTECRSRISDHADCRLPTPNDRPTRRRPGDRKAKRRLPPGVCGPRLGANRVRRQRHVGKQRPTASLSTNARRHRGGIDPRRGRMGPRSLASPPH